MYLVKKRKTGEIKIVYAVLGLSFLLWDPENDTWFFGDIAEYEPVIFEGGKNNGKANCSS